MQVKRGHRTFAATIALVAAATALAACSSGGDTASGAGASSAGTGSPRYGGTAVIALGQIVKSYDETFDTDGQGYYVDNNVLSKLVAYDSDYTAIHPDLATSWTASKDLKTYTFTLRSGVKWSDGQPFSSADVAFTYNAVLKAGPKAYTYALYSDIESVDAKGPDTVVFHLKQPNGILLEQLADYYGAYILPKHIYANGDPFTNPANQHPVGTGPFTFVSETPTGTITLVPNKYYYGQKPYLDKVVFQVFSNSATATAALQSGGVQYNTMSPSFTEVAALSKTPGLGVESTPYPLIQYATFNVKAPIVSNPKVRQALSMATDRSQINTQVFAGLAKPANDEFLSWSWANDPSKPQPKYDVAAANKLLDQAGYPRASNGTRFSLTYKAFSTSIFGTTLIPQILKQQWAEVGVNLNIETYDYSLKQQMINTQKNFQIVSSGGIQGPDPNELASSLTSTGSLNISGDANTKLDQLFAEGASYSTNAERKPIYSKIWAILNQDMPRLNFVEYPLIRVYSTNGHGWPGTAEAQKLSVAGDMYNQVWLNSGKAHR